MPRVPRKRPDIYVATGGSRARRPPVYTPSKATWWTVNGLNVSGFLFSMGEGHLADEARLLPVLFNRTCDLSFKHKLDQSRPKARFLGCTLDRRAGALSPDKMHAVIFNVPSHAQAAAGARKCAVLGGVGSKFMQGHRQWLNRLDLYENCGSRNIYCDPSPTTLLSNGVSSLITTSRKSAPLHDPRPVKVVVSLRALTRPSMTLTN